VRRFIQSCSLSERFGYREATARAYCFSVDSPSGRPVSGLCTYALGGRVPRAAMSLGDSNDTWCTTARQFDEPRFERKVAARRRDRIDDEFSDLNAQTD